jgi:hypothetical protein
MTKFYVREQGEAEVIGVIEAASLADAQAMAQARHYTDVDITDQAPEGLPDWLTAPKSTFIERANGNPGTWLKADHLSCGELTFWDRNDDSHGYQISVAEYAGLLCDLARRRGYSVSAEVEASLIAEADAQAVADLAALRAEDARIAARNTPEAKLKDANRILEVLDKVLPSVRAEAEQRRDEAAALVGAGV